MKIQFKKYQAGGAFAPFLSSYTPVVTNSQYSDPVLQYLASVGSVGASTGTTASTKSSSKSSSGDSIDMKDTISLLKDMRGLDNDVSQVTSQLIKNAQYESLFGSGDPTVAYYKNLNLINKVIESKEEYKNAYDQAKSQNALSEAAISSDGKVVVKTSKGYNLVTPEQALKLQQLGKGLIQKNADLLNDRKHNPNMAFQNGVLNIVENSVSFDSISKVINAIAGKLGTSTIHKDGYSTKEGEQIKSGIAALKSAGMGSMNGVYKVTFESETQEAQAKMAVAAIYKNLNATQRAYLKLNSGGTDKGALSMVKGIVMGQTSSKQSVQSEYQKDLLPDGSKRDSSGSSSGTGPEATPSVMWAEGYGNKGNYKIIADGNTQVGYDIISTSTSMLDSSGNPMGIATLSMLKNGQLGGVLNMNYATMNGVRIRTDSLNNVVADGGQIYQTELPIDMQAARQGVIKPDLKLIKKIESVNQNQLKGIANKEQLTAHDKQIINQVYKRNGIQAKYDSNGQLTAYYKRFAMINGTAAQSALTDEDFDITPVKMNNTDTYVQNVNKLNSNSDKHQYGLQTSWLGMKQEPVYQGTIFIPMNNDFVSMYTGSGIKLKQSEVAQAQANQIRRDAILSRYNNPGNLQM